MRCMSTCAVILVRCTSCIVLSALLLTFLWIYWRVRVPSMHADVALVYRGAAICINMVTATLVVIFCNTLCTVQLQALFTASAGYIFYSPLAFSFRTSTKTCAECACMSKALANLMLSPLFICQQPDTDTSLNTLSQHATSCIAHLVCCPAIVLATNIIDTIEQ